MVEGVKGEEGQCGGEEGRGEGEEGCRWKGRMAVVEGRSVLVGEGGG